MAAVGDGGFDDEGVAAGVTAAATAAALAAAVGDEGADGVAEGVVFTEAAVRPESEPVPAVPFFGDGFGDTAGEALGVPVDILSGGTAGADADAIK